MNEIQLLDIVFLTGIKYEVKIIKRKNKVNNNIKVSTGWAII